MPKCRRVAIFDMENAMAERTPAKTNTQKLREITDSLPEFTHQYFYSGTSSKAILTRLSYALDIRYFLEYAVNFLPYFPVFCAYFVTLIQSTSSQPRSALALSSTQT